MKKTFSILMILATVFAVGFSEGQKDGGVLELRAAHSMRRLITITMVWSNLPKKSIVYLEALFR